MNGPGFGMSPYFQPDIDWREKGRGEIRSLIGWVKCTNPCSECHIDYTLENFGLCPKCWDIICRKLKICAVCYMTTRNCDGKSLEWLVKNWDNWKKTYCSEKCRGVAKSRRFRKNNPDKKMRANYNYLKFLKKEGDF